MKEKLTTAIATRTGHYELTDSKRIHGQEILQMHRRNKKGELAVRRMPGAVLYTTRHVLTSSSDPWPDGRHRRKTGNATWRASWAGQKWIKTYWRSAVGPFSPKEGIDNRTWWKCPPPGCRPEASRHRQPKYTDCIDVAWLPVLPPSTCSALLSPICFWKSSFFIYQSSSRFCCIIVASLISFCCCNLSFICSSLTFCCTYNCFSSSVLVSSFANSSILCLIWLRAWWNGCRSSLWSAFHCLIYP